MSMRTPRIASRFGALDSTAIDSGAAAHAHVLRTIAGSANRLLAQGEPLLQLIFDSSSDAPIGLPDYEVGSEEEMLDLSASPGETASRLDLGTWYILVGSDPSDLADWSAVPSPSSKPAAAMGFGVWPGWQRLYWGPIVVPKKSSSRLAEAKAWIQLSGTSQVHLQIATTAAPFSEEITPESRNVMRATGDGLEGWQAMTLSGIPLGSGLFESFDFYINGGPTNTPVDTNVFGANASGTVTDAGTAVMFAGAFGMFEDSTSTWAINMPWSTGDQRIVAIFSDPVSHAPLLSPIPVAGSSPYPTILRLDRPLSPDEAKLIKGAHYELRKHSQWRLASLSIYSTDREAA